MPGVLEHAEVRDSKTGNISNTIGTSGLLPSEDDGMVANSSNANFVTVASSSEEVLKSLSSGNQQSKVSFLRDKNSMFGRPIQEVVEVESNDSSEDEVVQVKSARTTSVLSTNVLKFQNIITNTEVDESRISGDLKKQRAD